MKIIKHNKRPKIIQVELKADPFTVWLDTRTEMRIERGDRLDDIAKVVLRQGWGLNKGSARKLVAYWFALGERLELRRTSKSKWKKRELRADPDRRYLTDLLS